MSEQRKLTASHWGTYEVVQRVSGEPTVAGIAEDPDPSPIGLTMLDAYQNGPRVLCPAVRAGWLEHGLGKGTGGRGREPFVEVTWDEAFTLVARELRRVIDIHGNAAIYGGSYGWASAGRFHHAQSQLRRFMHLIGGCTVHKHSYSYAAAQALLPHIVADMQGYLEVNHSSWDVLAAHTRLFVAFGGLPWKNAQMSVGGATEHRLRGGLAAAMANGCRFVNFSVVRNDPDLPAAVCEWIPIRPNTDTAVMLALACEIIRSSRHNRAFLDRYCVGYEQWERYLLGTDDGIVKDANWAGPIANVEPARLRSLALDMACEDNGKRTMVNAAWSLQRADHGEQPYWALIALAAVIGQIGLAGGGFGVGYGCENKLGSAHPLVGAGPRVPAAPNLVDTFIPVARIADMLERPGEEFDFDGRRLRYPDVRLVYWAGGNPFHHHQDLNRLLLAWRRPETIVVHEQVWNANAKFADIVLPASSTVEREDIGFAYREPLVVAMRRLFDPPGRALDDHAIFTGISAKMDVAEQFTEGRTTRAWLEQIWEQWRSTLVEQGFTAPSFGEFWSAGMWRLPRASRPVVMLDAFRADPDLNRLQTPSGRIEIHSKEIASFRYPDCPPHLTWLEPAEWLGSSLAARYPLHMLSDQPHTKLHSQLDFSALSRANKVQGREPVWINPTDAATRGISDGDVVRLFNDRGACLAGAKVTDAIVAGVVKLSTGAWWDPEEPGVPGSLDKHGNPNVLTRDRGTSSLGQGCSAQSCLVQIERYRDPVPPITAFDLPRLVPLPA
ncbi:MAG: molybdopterin-dependent oxidoreductase [Candidatus Limnocylindrales bacterium]